MSAVVRVVVVAICILAAGGLVVPAVWAQAMDGRLEISVRDASGAAVAASLELVSRDPEFRAEAQADPGGHAVLRRLPLGTFLLTARHPGFSPAQRLVDVRSAVPQAVEVVLQIEALQGGVTVRASAPLLEPLRPSQPTRAGRLMLDRAMGTTLGRSAVDVVTAMPGWLLEANAVLHPRGSEYDTQYVVDGMPVYDNRSIAFAPAFESEEFEAVSVFTAGIPAEYGRRLGGVIALDSRRSVALGHHSTAHLHGGSYANRLAYLGHQFASRDTEMMIGIQGGATDRYLDPPSLQNFTNRGSSGGLIARFARDLNRRDRLSLYARSSRTGFLVPNDLEQQEAGQRQDRRSRESAGQAHYQAAVASGALVSLRGMVRELSSELWSNEFSTPVHVLQDRGFREGALTGDVTWDGERHTLKLGGDARWNLLDESFQMAEAGELDELEVDFRDSRRSTDASVFVQDTFHAGNFAASLGMRLDYYRLLIQDSALSPRLAASYYVPGINLQMFASYDRVFQPPPAENLLLSSSAAGLGLDAIEGAIPVPASRANFLEAGFRKPLGDRMRLVATHYWRGIRNAIDDDVFLNTGLSFPITFESAQIRGTEVRLEVPYWKGFSGTASYSNMLGLTTSPVTGGLFIEGGEAEELRDLRVEFPISQDQRNTVAAMVRFELHRRLWVAAAVRYGSGLPVELDDDDDDDDDDGDDDHMEEDSDEDEASDIPGAVLDSVNFERSRVRPNLSLDFSVGSRIWTRGTRQATLQFDVRNIADRLNVINFSGLFSGTALAPGRQATLQLRLHF